MKTLLLTTAMTAGLAFPTLAEESSTIFQTEAAGPAVAASDMIGARIYASEAAVDADAYTGIQDGWNDIGEVNDIILGRDGSVDAVLVDIGGFLGIGERQVAVDMAALRFVQDDATDADDWFLVMQADRSALDTAPVWGMAGHDAGEQAQAEIEAEATPSATTDALPEGYAVVERERLTAEMLTGANVRDTTDASIAEISDLVLTADGQVTDVVLDVGGFLGVGAKPVALPLDRLTVAQGGSGDLAIWVDMSKEELEALPKYEM